MQGDERRLQVGNIGLRTVFEILFTMCAVVFCVLLILNSFENDYANSSNERLGHMTERLASYLEPGISADALRQTEDERGEFVREQYSKLLDSCLTSGDVVYSGAIYTLENGMLYTAAQSSNYDRKNDVSATDAMLRIVYAGEKTTVDEGGEESVTFVPLRDSGGEVYAMLEIRAMRHSSIGYEGIVRNRLLLFAGICCLSVVVYFTISGILSSRRKHKEASAI